MSSASEHDDPVAELDRLWRIWQPQRDGYLTRGIDPCGAPRYGAQGEA